ncbi:GPI inositol deacylase 2 [Trypanosoma equiperdum]|uniref:GPI inositol-deacylase n=1 Tax=Trypanosoma equiperdum TaxID=5694 RepID=A0A1G4HZI1_TRYEQ|nr:GPI inositol deacylase 2 [Trypanosoma equiperdum]
MRLCGDEREDDCSAYTGDGPVSGYCFDKGLCDEHMPSQEDEELSEIGAPSSGVNPAATSLPQRKKNLVVLFTLFSLAAALLYALSVVRLGLQIRDYANNNRFRVFPDSVAWHPLSYRRLFLQNPKWGDERSNRGSSPPYSFFEVSCPDCYSTYAPTQEKPPEVIIFFAHGNAGSYMQAHRLGILFLQEQKIKGRLYTFDFSEQANAHRGALLHHQADFVADTIITLYEDRKNETHNPPFIWLIGHSMGGVVVRMALSTLSDSQVFPLIAGVITLNSPNRQMPVFLDLPMWRLYKTLWDPVQKNVLANDRNGYRNPRILSLTSGPLDLMVQSKHTRLSDSIGCNNGSCIDVTTEHPKVCGKTFSHDDIMRDYCVVEFWTSAVIRNSLVRGDGISPESRNLKLRNWSLPEGINDPAPPPHSFSDAFSWWAEASYTHVGLTVLVAFSYGSFVLSAIHPLLLRLLLNLRVLSHCCADWSWKSLFTSSHTAVVMVTPIMGIVGHLLLVQIPCCLLPAMEGCKSPWIADTLVCKPTFDPLMLVWCAFAASGPALKGIWMGIIAYRLLQLLLRGSKFGWTKFWLVTHRACIYLRLPRWVRRSPTRSDDNCDEPWNRIIPVTVFGVVVFLCGVLLPLRICDRALVWLCLTIVLLPLSASYQTATFDSSDGRREEAYMLVSAYALLHLIHLHPFFAWRNALRSATFDDATVVDFTSRAVEVLLLVLILSYVMWPLYHEQRFCEQLHRDKLSSLAKALASPWIQRLSPHLCILLVLIPLVWMISVPVASFRIVWVLLYAFPCFLLGPALVSGGSGGTLLAPGTSN